MSNFNLLDEEEYNNKNYYDNNYNNNNKLFLFKHNNLNKFESPYIFNKSFIKNNYNIFIKNISYLLKCVIYKCELNYLNKNYGMCLIKNKYKLSDIIKKKCLYKEFISLLIINKRIEYLQEYISDNNFGNEYINYVNKLLNTLYKDTKNFCL